MRLLLPALVMLMTGSACADRVPEQFRTGMQALTEGNYAEAYCLWKPLADRGYAEAQYHLGWLYANGNGLAVDIERAVAYWKAAAQQGHADAQFAIALAYTTGEGMKKDLDVAVSWYLKAARTGHQDAREILLRLNGDRSVHLLEKHPELAREDWFGWRAEVSGERINVRDGPGTNHKVVATLEQGTGVRVVGTNGDWYMVVLPSTKRDAAVKVAWIYRTLLSRNKG
ncbi:MAG: SEL1-like repeat protein [Gammaproteobacteria bacterium]|nr:SEL1-like repeat protein [Gammaproteobacteria bacterium]MCP5299580.1 SEL1-like repeat protein [Chromatiaceae bacterium]